MDNVRCLIADMPQLMLADIVQTMAEENECIEVIDRVSNNKDLPEIIKKKSIDVLILGLKNNQLPSICNDVLNSTSNLLVVGLVDEGRRATIYLDDIGGNEIVKIIKTLGRRPAFKR